MEGRALIDNTVYQNEIVSQVLEIYKKGGAQFFPEVETRENVPGAARWVSLYFYGIVKESGEVESVVTLTQDITIRKERERELQALISLSSALRSAVTRSEMQPIILDQVQRLLRVDAAGIVLRDPENYDVLVGVGSGEWSTWDERHAASPQTRGSPVKFWQPPSLTSPRMCMPTLVCGEITSAG